MIRGLFITGTDTGVGKTVVAAGLLRRLRAEGIDAVPMKPVQTGGLAGRDGMRSGDLDYCLHAGRLQAGGDEYLNMCPYIYEPACSPHLAGRLAGGAPEIGRIVQAASALAARHEAIVVEGAGGVLVPVNETETMLDLMVALALPVVLVARGELGTLNHSLLSLRALRSAGLTVVGVIVCDTTPAEPDFVRADNPQAIADFGDVPILGEVPFVGDLRGKRPFSFAWRLFDDALTGLPDILRAVLEANGKQSRPAE